MSSEFNPGGCRDLGRFHRGGERTEKGGGGEGGASIIPDFEIEQVDGVPKSSELLEQTPRNQAILTIWKLLPQAHDPIK